MNATRHAARPVPPAAVTARPMSRHSGTAARTTPVEG